MYPDDLKAAIDLIEWLNENAGEQTTLWRYSAKIQIENPEHNQPVGWAVWHGDGFWYFKGVNDV